MECCEHNNYLESVNSVGLYCMIVIVIIAVIIMSAIIILKF